MNSMSTSVSNTNQPTPRAHYRSSRVVAFVLVVCAHTAFAMLWFLEPVRLRMESAAIAPMFADWLEQEPPADAVLVQTPDVTPEPLAIPPPELPDMSVAALIDEPALEAPKIDPFSGPDVAAYSQRAQLTAGKTATVLLMVGIGVDGAVISARVVRSNGDEAANAAALDYARATHWIPGTIDGQPRMMEASLTVILGESGVSAG